MSLFELDKTFINKYKNKKPKMSDLGFIVYKRTYSRKKEDGSKEDFWETVKRVVEGTYSIQKDHCRRLELPWIEEKAQRSAQRMYEKIWNFKFTPPGRGFWMMGTDFVKERGSMSLNNCAFVSTKNIKEEGSKPFRFCMDALMLGVGVGFDTKGEGDVQIKKPTGEFQFTIPDSREGWVEALGYVLDAFFKGMKMPELDYSEIRPAGEPIKGFGGVASGPGPLKELIEDVKDDLYSKVGLYITSTDILDIMNRIAKCVIAGNIRRSAEIALGEPTDYDFILSKQDKEKMKSHRWASNNSIIAQQGMNYEFVCDQIRKNGEPGLVWLENARAYSRMQGKPDFKDEKVDGCNPCFTGDTLIGVADGRGAVPIKQLAEEGKDIPVYSINRDGMVEIKMGRHPRLTGSDKKLLRITFEDGCSMRVTPDHKMILLNGEYIEAQNLEPGDNLPRFSKYVDDKYLRLITNTRNREKDKKSEHRLIAKFFNKNKWNRLYDEGHYDGFMKTNNIVVHHKDGNTLNNNPDNLEIMTFAEHSEKHGFYDVKGEKNHMFGKAHSEQAKRIIGEKTRIRCKHKEFREKLSNSIKKGMDNKEVREKISVAKKENWKEFYEEFEEKTDLETTWKNDRLYVKKNCEVCGKEMILPLNEREKAYCSHSCLNKSKEHIKKRKQGQKKYFENRQRNVLHKQINVFKDLKQELERDPYKKEWAKECSNLGISHRCNKHSDNPYVLENYTDLKQRAREYNHRVKSVEICDEKEDVYNITVDDNHTVAVVTDFDKGKCDGIMTFNCGEQSLESYELCCLVETFPSHHKSFEEFQETLKYAYLYAKTVTLMNTHWKESNAVMLKNRRIGVSQSGIVQAFNKLGRRRVLNWCQQGYKYLRELDTIYSDWLCVPKSIKISSVKPSGTVSILADVTHGIHFPHSKYFIRRVRMSENSDLLDELEKANYPIYDDPNSHNTKIVEFPIERSHYKRGKKEVSMWEQAQNAADYQKYWSDNQVSVTITFKEEEADDLEFLLECFEDKLKSVSFLPLRDHGYKNAPYEAISRQEYKHMIKDIEPVNFLKVKDEALGEKYCNSEKCLL